MSAELAETEDGAVVEVPGTVSIAAAAQAAGVSADTVRYYDRCGLLEDLGRDAAGNRRFTAGDVGWLRVLRCLRATGMSIQGLRVFCATDAHADPATRLALLEAHRDGVRERISRTEEELAVVEVKIAAYRDLVAAGVTGTPEVTR